MAATFLSGADEAILYESVDAMGRKAEYSKITGRMRAVETISAMLAVIGVGYIASFNLVLPVILASIIYALSILPIWLMKETGGASLPIKDQVKPPSYLHTVREAWAVLSGFVVLRWSAAYLVVLGSVSFYVAVFFQPYILALGFTLAVLGPATVLIQLFGIAGSLSVDKVQHKIGSTNLLFLAPLIIVPGLVLTGAVRLIPNLSQALGFSAVIGAAGLSSFFFSMTQPVLLSVIQGRVSSEARATLLSIQSALFTIFLIITEPGLGVIADHFGVHFSYLGMAGVTAAFLFPLLWWGRRWFKNGVRHIHEIPG